MKIKYEFATGEVIEIEVEETIEDVVIKLEREEYNGNRKETRRHVSYSDDNDKKEALVDKTANVEVIAEWNEDKEKLKTAISQLKPHQHELVQKIFYKGLSETEVARAMGVSQQAISKQLKVIYKNIKNFLN